MVSIPAVNVSGLCRSVSSVFKPLHPATRLFANSVFYPSLVVAGGAATLKWYLDPMSDRRDECLKGALVTLSTKNTRDTTPGTFWGTYKSHRTLTQKERLEATSKCLKSQLEAQDKPLKNPLLGLIVRNIDRYTAKIDAAKPEVTPDQQDAMITTTRRLLGGLQMDTAKWQNIALIGSLAFGTSALLLKLGVPSAALRAVRVIS